MSPFWRVIAFVGAATVVPGCARGHPRPAFLSRVVPPTAGSATLVGIVQDSAGLALQGALVGLRAADGGPAPSPLLTSATTDRRGAFVLSAIAPGDYLLRVTRQCYRPAQRPVTLAAGRVDSVVISLRFNPICLDCTCPPP